VLWGESSGASLECQVLDSPWGVHVRKMPVSLTVVIGLEDYSFVRSPPGMKGFVKKIWSVRELHLYFGHVNCSKPSYWIIKVILITQIAY